MLPLLLTNVSFTRSVKGRCKCLVDLLFFRRLRGHFWHLSKMEFVLLCFGTPQFKTLPVKQLNFTQYTLWDVFDSGVHLSLNGLVDGVRVSPETDGCASVLRLSVGCCRNADCHRLHSGLAEVLPLFTGDRVKYIIWLLTCFN